MRRIAQASGGRSPFVGYAVLANWRAPNVLEVVGKRKGEVIGVGPYKVSADGNTMTVEDAACDQHLVFDRS